MTICVDQDRLCTDLRADGRVRSRLRSAETVRLDRYAQAELVDIVQYRVEHGFDTGLVADGADGAVAAIADLAARDAREAISLLRHGARNVRQGHAEELTADVVHEVAGEAREGIRERLLYVDRGNWVRAEHCRIVEAHGWQRHEVDLGRCAVRDYRGQVRRLVTRQWHSDAGYTW